MGRIPVTEIKSVTPPLFMSPLAPHPVAQERSGRHALMIDILTRKGSEGLPESFDTAMLSATEYEGQK